ncbi:glycosyltransferase [Thalassobellus suaedae]|uniref:Glycosyltransferase n=1 Tax=Thalassobellus suaedae TaxID=3074124 RepID=A0ABY9XWJ7_9FLAO|nr:glycosyltransferase [Flavobacteriaceae bacterium HL-DH14]
MLLTIIIPVYNVQDYLKKCIDSLFIQDLNTNEYEVIAVNDGSTDNSLNTLKKIQENYNSLKIITQNNQGLSVARNTGMKHATGDYLLFVDADDYILENSLRKTLIIAQQNQLDILEFAASGVTEEGREVYVSQNSSNGKVMTGEQYLSNIKYMSSACNKLYNRVFLNNHEFRFMPNVYIEDIEFNTRVVFKASRIQATDKIVAHFLQRDGSITRTKNLAKTKKMIYDIHKVLTSINTFNESVITPNSTLYIPVKKTTCSLITTMLLRVLKDIDDYTIKRDIFDMLKKQELYPLPYKTGDQLKDKFRVLVNQNILFSIICKFYCFKNKLYGSA